MEEGHLSPDGALMVNTGASTGRSTKERYVVQRPEVESDIAWGGVNQPISPEFGQKFFTALENRIMNGGPLFQTNRLCWVFSSDCEFKKSLAHCLCQKYVSSKESGDL